MYMRVCACAKYILDVTPTILGTSKSVVLSVCRQGGNSQSQWQRDKV